MNIPLRTGYICPSENVLKMKQMWASIKCVPTLPSSLRFKLRGKLFRISQEVTKQEATAEKKRQWRRKREQMERREEEEGDDTD
jgi:hypothetical protein